MNQFYENEQHSLLCYL